MTSLELVQDSPAQPGVTNAPVMEPVKTAGNTDISNHATRPAINAGTAGLTASLLFTGCGGGTDATPAPTLMASSTVSPAFAITDADASRFLAQASMGASRAQIASVKALGYAGWLDAQFAMPASASRWDWLVSKGFNSVTYKNSEAGFDASAWRKLISSPDTLRQRITLALSEITVVAIDGLVGSGWRAFSAAA